MLTWFGGKKPWQKRVYSRKMVTVHNDELDKSVDKVLDNITGLLGEEIFPFGVACFVEKFFPDLHKKECTKDHLYSFNVRNVSVLVRVNEFPKYKEVGDRPKEFRIIFRQPC